MAHGNRGCHPFPSHRIPDPFLHRTPLGKKRKSGPKYPKNIRSHIGRVWTHTWSGSVTGRTHMVVPSVCLQAVRTALRPASRKRQDSRVSHPSISDRSQSTSPPTSPPEAPVSTLDGSLGKLPMNSGWASTAFLCGFWNHILFVQR